ncbi:MAG: hypothetical protein M1814_002399 [Vezdaea aestivalis]|nr:MAG: hypothetical protein M1814_002399 [Vezdaea aestivalis]
MGSCLSSRKSGGFQGEGRTLANAPARPVQPAGQRLGSSPRQQRIPKTSAVNPTTTQGRAASGDQDMDARRMAAAAAAEERAKASTARLGSGKLAQEADRRKKQTRTDTLKEASDSTRREREIDQQAEWQRM